MSLIFWMKKVDRSIKLHTQDCYKFYVSTYFLHAPSQPLLADLENNINLFFIILHPLKPNSKALWKFTAFCIS